MILPTSKFNINIQDLFCKQIGISCLAYETYFDSKEFITVIQDREIIKFYPIKVRFIKDEIKLSCIVKPVVKSYITGAWPFEYETYNYDLEAMKEEILNMIKECPINVNFTTGEL